MDDGVEITRESNTVPNQTLEDIKEPDIICCIAHPIIFSSRNIETTFCIQIIHKPQLFQMMIMPDYASSRYMDPSSSNHNSIRPAASYESLSLHSHLSRQRIDTPIESLHSDSLSYFLTSWLYFVTCPWA